MSLGRQIRAARGLLRWSAAALAEKAGLTRDTINKIEDEAVQPREGTLKDIVRVFDENGVEFTDNYGVRLKPQGVEVLVGHDGLCRFFDGVYEHMSKHGGTIMVTGVDENDFSEHLGNYSSVHVKRMTKLTQERHDIKVLSLIKEGDTNYVCSDYSEYRWLPPEMFDPVPFYIYGDRLAIMSFQTIPSPTIVVHNIPAITHAYKKQFEALWNMSKEPPKK